MRETYLIEADAEARARQARIAAKRLRDMESALWVDEARAEDAARAARAWTEHMRELRAMLTDEE